MQDVTKEAIMWAIQVSEVFQGLRVSWVFWNTSDFSCFTYL